LLTIIFFIILVGLLKSYFGRKSENNDNNYDENIRENTENYNSKIVTDDELIFYLNNSPVSLGEIEDNFYGIFYEDDDGDGIDNLFDAYYKKDVILYYEHKNKKLQISKFPNSSVSCIKAYYESGNIMYDFKIIDDYNVELSEYGDKHGLISTDRYTTKELDVTKYKIDVEEEGFNYNIVLFYKVLETKYLNKLIDNNNKHSLPRIRKNRKNASVLTTVKPKEKSISAIKVSEIHVDNTIQELPKVESIKVENTIKSKTTPVDKSTSTEHKDGPFRNYYESGALKNTGSYKDNKLHSKYVEYYPNGRIKKEGLYDNGNKIGKWRYYSDKGVIEAEKEF
jgi:Uncharacterized protein conserved in bacteria